MLDRHPLRRAGVLTSLLTSVWTIGLLPGTLSAQVTVVDEGFESYPDDFEFTFAWEPVPFTVVEGWELTTDEEMFPGIEGQAILHEGGFVNQWFPFPDPFDPIEGDDVLEPTEEHSIVFGGDLFISSSNMRMTIGLRSNDPANILEIGAYNSEPETFAYRHQLFQGENVNWEFFELPLSLDTTDDGLVTPGDFGPAWHRFQATVTPTDVTFELDVFRDGTVDATSVIETMPHEAGFNSLRIGGPSGVSSAVPGVFDNVFLRLVEPTTGGEDVHGDYNDNGRVEQGDLDLVLLNWGQPFDTLPDTWVNQRPTMGIVDQVELDGVLLNWGSTELAGSVAAAVPEPSGVAISLAAMATLWLFRSRKLRGRQPSAGPYQSG